MLIQIAAAVLLLLGTGLIFKALVEMDRPTARPRPLARRTSQGSDEEVPASLRRAA